MKLALIGILLLASSMSFAKNCKLNATVQTNDFDHCVGVSFQFEAADADACKQLAQDSKKLRLYGILEEKEEVLKITYKYKQSSPKLKVKETIHFVDQEDIDDICW